MLLSTQFVDIYENLLSGRYSMYNSIPNCKVEILLEIIQMKCTYIPITTIQYIITFTI